MAVTRDRGPRLRQLTLRLGRAQPFWVRIVGVYFVLLAALLLTEHVSFVAARVPLQAQITATEGSFALDGSTLRLPWTQRPTAVIAVRSSPLVREFQLDGSDSTNNFTEDTAYLSQVADSPYYQFQAWMRDASTYSGWRDLVVEDNRTGSVVTSLGDPGDRQVALPQVASSTLGLQVERLETPAHLLFLCGDTPCAEVVIDRNNRSFSVQDLLPNGASVNARQTFFPIQAGPFFADVVNLVAHIGIWALLLLGFLVLDHCVLSLAVTVVHQAQPRFSDGAHETRRSWGIGNRMWRFRARVSVWDLLATCIVVASFGFTLFIALAQYHAQPHILDASAYVFQAKIFASGHLAVTPPADLSAFQGPFMVAHAGRWFAQYPPATSALLAVGFVAHVPWLVEPLLGAAGLWGIYRLGTLMFSAREGCLAVALGALSAFYLYLAASYLSHTVALFFAVYFLLYLVRFAESHRGAHLATAAASLGGLLLTRELTAALLGVGATALVIVFYRRSLWQDRLRIYSSILAALAIVMFAGIVYLLYNQAQTGDALTLPRTLFSPSDRYGFGQGIGFYGQHTLAAGLVNLDQLLTILLIDLFGWPFYLTLAFVPLALLRGRALLRWDLFCLVLGSVLVLAQVGYFYHGIYLGPRYLFETLPFLLLLTARGMTATARFLSRLGERLAAGRPLAAEIGMWWLGGAVVGTMVLCLIACNVVYYLPRQLELHTNYTGLPVAQPVDANALYAFHPPHALVLTDDWFVYNYILWPLNDPALRGMTLYAYAPTPSDQARLHAEYPGRTIYVVDIAPGGHVTFLRPQR